VTGIKPVTRLPFVGLCGWVVQSLSPHNIILLLGSQAFLKTEELDISFKL
jgi:hypothetical protein